MKSTNYALKYHCANMATSTGRENAKKPGICIDYAEPFTLFLKSSITLKPAMRQVLS